MTVDLRRNIDEAGLEVQFFKLIGKSYILVSITVEDNVLDGLACVTASVELEHTEDVLVYSFKYIVIGVTVVGSIDGSET